MRKWLVRLAALLGLMAVGAGSASGWTQPGLLNLLDRLSPPDAREVPVRQVARAVSYGPDEVERVDVWAPARLAPGQRAPVIVWFHGGGWTSGSREAYGFAGRAFASRGFVTVVAGYRLGEAGRWPRFMEDAAAAVRWARHNASRYGGEGERLVLAGRSAGAHIATLVALDRRWLGSDNAVVAGVIGLAGPYDWLPFEPGSGSDRVMGRAQPIGDTQPVNFARADAPPMWLAWGTADTSVKRRNIDNLSAALRRVGAPVEVQLYPGMTHAGSVMPLARPFRRDAPLLDDAVAAARRMLAQRRAEPGGDR